MSLVDQLREHLDHQEACSWHLDWPEALAGIRAVLDMHRPSVFPVSTGPDRGQRYCVACTSSVDHHTLHVVVPCPTVNAMADALEVTTRDTVYTDPDSAPAAPFTPAADEGRGHAT